MPSDEARRIRQVLTQRGPDVATPVEESRLSWEAAVAETNAGLTCRVMTLDMAGIPGELVAGQVTGTTDAPAVLLLHGGGFTTGSPRTHRELAHRISVECGGSVFLPEYRLAPEHPCPAAVGDAVTSYRWLLEQGYPSEQIVVAGDSAGGALVVALLVAIRDLDLPRPAGSVLISPWVDLTMSGLSYGTHVFVRSIHYPGRTRRRRWFLSRLPRPARSRRLTALCRPIRPTADIDSTRVVLKSFRATPFDWRRRRLAQASMCG